MRNRNCLLVAITFLYLLFAFQLSAKTDKYRVMWRDDPATTMVVGWNQISGDAVSLHYDVQDFGKDILSYQYSALPSKKNFAKGMNNHFVRLTNLIPGTVYWFVIKDSEGCTESMSFKTASSNPNERLSIIAGGDSRNYRKARQKANKLVSKLRPDCVMFGGDMTGGDNATQWKAWMNDWQETITNDRRLIPIIVTRGNHEYSNRTLVDLFDIAPPQAYYALSLGGDLLRVYTLNSLIPSGGDQKVWLENDLANSTHYTWRFAQYHFAIRPHTSKKSERNNQARDWATLFEKYQVQLAVESDAHCVKWTYPIIPSREKGSDEGFVRDDEKGTTYIGEGCWGAPLRRNNDDKKWTRNSGSFNQFKWIFVDQDKIEIRTVKTDKVEGVEALEDWDRFTPPFGLDIWQPSNGSVVTIYKQPALASYDYVSAKGVGTTSTSSVFNFDVATKDEGVLIKWSTENELNNNKVYEIQQSVDGVNFSTVAEVKSKGIGNHQYEFFKIKDTGIWQELTFRLKENISSNRFQVYGEKKIVVSDQNLNKLIPEQENGMIRAKYVVEAPSNVVIRLVDQQRKVIAKSDYKNLNSGNYLQSIDMKEFPEGQYMLTIKADEEVIQQYLVVK